MTVGDVKFEIEGRDVASERGIFCFQTAIYLKFTDRSFLNSDITIVKFDQKKLILKKIQTHYISLPVL